MHEVLSAHLGDWAAEGGRCVTSRANGGSSTSLFRVGDGESVVKANASRPAAIK